MTKAPTKKAAKAPNKVAPAKKTAMLSQPVDHRLPPLKWVESPNVSSRGGVKVDLIVTHSCQGHYHGSVNWFANRASEVSAHIVVSEDGKEATQCARYSDKAWHVCSFNRRSIGVEMAGWAEKGFEQAEWETEANIVAFLLHKFRIPCKWSKDGSDPGFCRHYDLGRAGGGHSDPTTDDQVWALFVQKVEDAFKAGGFPTVWGKD